MKDTQWIGGLTGWALAGVVYYMSRSLGFDPLAWAREGIGMVVLSAVAATVTMVLFRRLALARNSFARGDRVIYSVQKFGVHPGPRAEDVYACPGGDGYSYIVRKPWTVLRTVGDDEIEVVTRGGKLRRVRTSDPHLHRAGAWEAFRFARRSRRPFPRPGAG